MMVQLNLPTTDWNVDETIETEEVRWLSETNKETKVGWKRRLCGCVGCEAGCWLWLVSAPSRVVVLCCWRGAVLTHDSFCRPVLIRDSNALLFSAPRQLSTTTTTTQHGNATMAAPLPYALEVTPDSLLQFTITQNPSGDGEDGSRCTMTLRHTGLTEECLAFKVR